MRPSENLLTLAITFGPSAAQPSTEGLRRRRRRHRQPRGLLRGTDSPNSTGQALQHRAGGIGVVDKSLPQSRSRPFQHVVQWEQESSLCFYSTSRNLSCSAEAEPNFQEWMERSRDVPTTGQRAASKGSDKLQALEQTQPTTCCFVWQGTCAKSGFYLFF